MTPLRHMSSAHLRTAQGAQHTLPTTLRAHHTPPPPRHMPDSQLPTSPPRLLPPHLLFLLLEEGYATLCHSALLTLAQRPPAGLPLKDSHSSPTWATWLAPSALLCRPHCCFPPLWHKPCCNQVSLTPGTHSRTQLSCPAPTLHSTTSYSLGWHFCSAQLPLHPTPGTAHARLTPTCPAAPCGNSLPHTAALQSLCSHTQQISRASRSSVLTPLPTAHPHQIKPNHQPAPQHLWSPEP